MAQTKLVHQEDRITFPVDSLLSLRILEARVDELPSRNGGTWEKLNCKFQIQQVLAIGGAGPDAVQYFANWVGEDIYGSVRFYLSDKEDNELRLWLEAIFEIPAGQGLPVGFEFDTNMLPGRFCRGITGQYLSKKTDTSGTPFPRHEVKSLLRPDGNAVAASQQQYAQPSPSQWGQPDPAAQQQAQQAPQGAQQAQWGQPAPGQYQQQAPAAQAAPAPQQQGGWATPGVQQQAPAAQPGLWQQPQGQPAQQAPAQQQYQQPQQQPVQGQPAQQIPGQQQQPPAPATDPWAGTEDWQEPGF